MTHFASAEAPLDAPATHELLHAFLFSCVFLHFFWSYIVSYHTSVQLLTDPKVVDCSRVYVAYSQQNVA